MKGVEIMTRINRIQSLLKTINGGQFQKIMDDYFSRRYNKVYSTGSALGNNNTKKGTPDSLIRYEDGKYIMIEYTVQESSLEAKLKADIKNCLDYEKTKIKKNKIKKIICCFVKPLTIDAMQRLYDFATKNKVQLELMSGDVISRKLLRYPVITKEHLNIEIDTGQIFELKDFIEIYNKGYLSSPINNRLIGREKEIDKVLSYIEKNTITIITGEPGIGKTEIALKAIREFKGRNSDFAIKCFRNNGQNFYEDLQALLEYERKILFLIDDANQVMNLNLFINELTNEDVELKFIMTVRSYAREQLKDKLKLFSMQEIQIEQLTDDDIKNICKETYNIKNQHILTRIVDIAKGNARLAVMASMSAKDDLLTIKKPGELLKVYYKSVENDFYDNFNNRDLLKTAAIISFLGSIHLENEENLNLINKYFQISKKKFEKSIQTLHNMEIIDIYKNKVVKVSDQILNTFIFYYVVFEKNLIKYSDFIYVYFPNLKNRMIQQINSLVFYFHDQVFECLKEEILKVFNEKEKHTEFKTKEFIITFWFALDTEPLIYAKDYINKMKRETNAKIDYDVNKNTYGSSDILDLLGNFSYTDYRGEALELIISYLDKKPSDFTLAYNTIVQNYGYTHESYINDHELQSYFIQELSHLYNKYPSNIMKMLVLRVAQYFLKFKYEKAQMKDSKQFTFITFIPMASKNLYNIRQEAWDIIRELINDSHTDSYVIEGLYKYGNSVIPEEGLREIVKFDREKLTKLIDETSKIDIIRSKAFGKVNNYLKRYDLDFDSKIKERYETTEYKMYKLISKDNFLSRKEKDKTKTELTEIAKTMKLEDFKSIYNVIESLTEENHGENTYFITYKLELLLNHIESKYLKDVLEEFFSRNLIINLNPVSLIQRIIKYYNLEEFEELIKKYNFHNKEYWLFNCLLVKSEQKTDDYLLDKLYSFFEKSELENVGFNLDLSFLKKFLSLDSKIFPNVTKMILEKSDRAVFISLNTLFDLHEHLDVNLLSVYSYDLNILKDAYIRLYQIDRHFDYKGDVFKKLVQKKISLIDEIAKVGENSKFFLSDKYEILSHLWSLAEYDYYITYYFNLLNRSKAINSYNKELIIRNFFSLNSSQRKETVIISQKKWIKSTIIQIYDDDEKLKLLFRGIAELSDEIRIMAIKSLIDLNKSLDTFKKIPFESNTFSFSGSEVPYLYRRRDFYIKLKNSLTGLDYLEHKKYLEQIINQIDKRIEDVKIEEFMNDII